ATTTLLPSSFPTSIPSIGIGASTTTASSSTKCKSGGVMFFGWCVPIWLLAVAAIALIGLAILLCWCILHYCLGCCFWLMSAAAAPIDVEKGPVTQKQSKTLGTQSEPFEETPKIALPPPAVAPLPIVAPIPIDYSSDKPETEDKGMMTDPWEPPEPVIIYRDMAPEPKVDYDMEPRALLPPHPMTARSEAPPLMETDEDEPVGRRIVAGPTALILRPARRRERSPDLLTPRESFPALPRRAFTDEEELPLPPKEKRTKKKREPVVPVIFQHNAPPEERPQDPEPESEVAPSRGPRAFPLPPPGSRTLASVADRPFPEQFKSPSPGPKPSRPLPSPPLPPP
ncbi:hypothetical protein PFISCL1PPCAC_26980, partial [Pristionchus fissidentatus]